jgi:hypothetical protein
MLWYVDEDVERYATSTKERWMMRGRADERLSVQ